MNRANSNFGGPKQRNNRLLPPDRTPQQSKEYKNQKSGTNKTHLLPSPKTNNTQTTSLMAPTNSHFTDETTKVSCPKLAELPGTNDDVRIMDTSNSSCLTSVCTPTKSNDTQSPLPPITNNTSHSKEKNYITTNITTTTTPNLDVKYNSETLVSNHPSSNSGYSSSYCTTIVKSKSEW